MGGVLATLPAYESDLFGPRHVGAIHSRSQQVTINIFSPHYLCLLFLAALAALYLTLVSDSLSDSLSATFEF